MTNRYDYNPPLSEPDFIVVDDLSSIVRIRPTTDDAWSWIDEHVEENAPFFGPYLCVERRYAADLAKGIAAAGFTIAAS